MVVAICFFSNVHICNDLFVYSVWSTFLTTFLRTFLSALRQEYFFEHFIDHFFELSQARALFVVLF